MIKIIATPERAIDFLNMESKFRVRTCAVRDRFPLISACNASLIAIETGSEVARDFCDAR